MDDFKELYKKFLLLKEQGWIKGVNNSTSGVGLTLEKFFNKDIDNLFFPDYYGIEFKSTTRSSKYSLTLFSIALEGPTLFETKRIVETYGKEDYMYHDKKTLIGTLKTKVSTMIGNYYFKIKINDSENKLILEIYDINNNLIENVSYITFKSLKERLEIKLSKMALFYADKNNINGENYYKYYNVYFYVLRNFETFIKLIKEDVIVIQILCSIARSGIKESKNKGNVIAFGIKKHNLYKLFKRINEKELNFE